MADARSLQMIGLALVISISTFAVSAEHVSAQYGAPTVSAVTLQTVPGQNGQQMVITPKGITVPLPGPGVNSNVVEVYIGSQGGYWYVDKNGQQFDLTEYVARLQQMQGQRPMQPVQTPQYAPAPAPVQVNNYESSGSSSSGGSGVGTAVAAGLGAMAGSAISGAYNYPYPNTAYWHGVPYGTPYHYNGNNGYAYVNRGGNTVNVDPNITRTNNVSRTNNINASATQVNSTVNSVSAQQNNYMRQQQDWYNNQAKANSQQFQNWRSNSNAQNPFVNSDAKYAWGNGQGQSGAAGGRFGGGEGRFGGAAEGGRFGGGRRRGR